MSAAYLVVRAVLTEMTDRARFDTWYQKEHLPDAMKAFQAQAAMRGWSEQDPTVHTAFYRFPSLEAAKSATGGAAIKTLIAEFDKVWGDRVHRTRDVLVIADELIGGSH
ncbi:hypothetical protein [Rhodopila sp.]|jgi:hypothetical protein|uniref:hypothetical protein n=1 Tax=Rhodopila sp. TaxID=2480087 RepID=UPI002C77859A|nr:hypothetical protein [Rhodopila sp.]HVZ10575.1 hypothetical protein [Rhodopila sp.]